MWNVQIFSELPSTQTLARDKLAAGTARHGDVFVALHQSSGRGQYQDRTWHDEPGSNLLMSIVLIDVNPQIVDLMQFVTGLSVLATVRSQLEQDIRAFDPERVRLKWPNDVLLDRRKIAGVLCEATWTGTTLKGIVLGVGININQEVFDPSVANTATSLRTVLEYSLSLDATREQLLATLQYSLRHYAGRGRLLSDLRTELAWMNTLSGVSAMLADGRRLGNIAIGGITDRGALHISDSNGVTHDLLAATLSIPL